MARLVHFLAPFGILLQGVALAGVSGVLVLDNKEIGVCGPVSGYIDLTTDEKTILEKGLAYHFLLQNDRVTVEIVNPEQEVLILDKEFFDWDPEGVFLRPQDYIWNPGITIRVPIFLMMYKSNFFFSTPGRYEVCYKFNNIPGRPVVGSTVMVMERSPGATGEFTSLFPDQSSYFTAHQGLAPQVTLPVEHEYYYEYAIVKTYHVGGAIMKYYLMDNFDDTPMKGFGLGSEKVRNMIQEGAQWASISKAHGEFWEKLEAKRSAYLLKDYSLAEISEDKNGVLYILP